MLLILLNWLVIFYITYTFGLAVRKLFIPPSGNSEIAMTVIWGLFVVSLVSTLCLFFIPAGFFLWLMLFLAATLIQFFSREEISRRLNFFRITLAGRREIIFGSLLLFSLLVFSAQPPKINDDGYYYTQTVMWFTEHGFVNGISNLLLPLGLGSSWHVLQAVFSFDFLEGIRLNDLNGFLVFIFFIYCLENGFSERQNLLLTFLAALALPVCIPFLSASSPDLPVIIFTIIAFYLISRPFGNRAVVDVLLLAAFAGSIGLSAVALVLLGAVLIFHAAFERVSVHPGIYFLVFLCVMTVVTKNIYQTGYPLYPFHWLGVTGLSWATPKELWSGYTAYLGGASELTNPAFGETISLLLKSEGYRGMINAFILLGFPLIAFTLMWDGYQRLRSGTIMQPQILLHAIFILNFFIWLLLAPQYRFIVPVYIFYIAWFFWRWLRLLNGKPFMGKIALLPYGSIIVLFLLSVVPVSLDVRSGGTHIGYTGPFSFKTLLEPHVSYSFVGIDTLRAGDREYYHVRSNIYCWDSPMPCMSESYHNFLLERGYEIFETGRGDKWEFVLRKQEGN